MGANHVIQTLSNVLFSFLKDEKEEVITTNVWVRQVRKHLVVPADVSLIDKSKASMR